MDLFLVRVHQMQIRHQCCAALNAAEQAETALHTRDQDLFWASIQSLLTAAANISKACWGAGGKKNAEREDLRKSLGVDDGNPLASTTLRNHLEHYDERLDRWYRESSQRIYVDFIIGPRKTTIAGVDDSDIFRFYDPGEKEVIFWGEHFTLQPIVDEIARLLPVATAESNKPHWQTP